jgi:hypothetical protein
MKKSILDYENLSSKEFADLVSDVMINEYGEHNYEDFKKVINQKLKL